MEGSDRVAGDLTLFNSLKESLRIPGTRDEDVNGDGAVDGVALPLIEDAVRHIGIVVVRESEDGFAGEDAVIGPFFQFGKEIRRGIAEEISQCGAAGSGIGLGIRGDGEQLVTGATVAKDEGEFADERFGFLDRRPL